MTQRYRRCITLPAFFIACAVQIIVWIMWLRGSVGEAVFWKSEKDTAMVMLVLIVVEWTMHDPSDGETRGFDVIQKD